jgi:hemoglobin-like flavoprotein
MEERILKCFDESFQRCCAQPRFLDIFYDRFLASSSKVRQKRALRASLYLILLAAQDERDGPSKYLRDLAHSHGAGRLNVGAELYDLWLDSLLSAVKECDPRFDATVEDAWEQVMMVGIRYLCTHYND